MIILLLFSSACYEVEEPPSSYSPDDRNIENNLTNNGTNINDNEDDDLSQILTPIDIDNDGDLDILLTNNRILAGVELYEIRLMENIGSQRLMPHIIATYYNWPQINYIDLDRDGDIDILCVVGAVGSVYWIENLGDKQFDSHFVDNSASGAYGISGSTMNRDDEFIDIIITTPNNTFWYKNDGNQNFTREAITEEMINL